MTARSVAAAKPSPGRPAANRLPLVALVLSVAVLAVGGIVASVSVISAGASEPAVQFRLLVGKNRKPVDEVRASFRPGTLQPDASISGQLKFVAPRNGSKLWIQFTDPKRGKPVLIDLGKTGTTPDNAFDGFHKTH
jgi:hypothetical protein